MTVDYKDNECLRIERLLSDYVDGVLSTRDTWEVEKHVATCRACAGASQQMRALVDALHAAPALDTSADFMSKLHARLDAVEPQQARTGTLWQAVADWLNGMREPMRVQRVPALGLAFGMAGLVALAIWNRPQPVTPAPAPPPHESLQRNVALTASNPFDDPVAATLEAHAAQTGTQVNLEVE